EVAASLVDNTVEDKVKAYVDAATVTVHGGVVDLAAVSYQDILSISVGIATEDSSGKFAAAGSTSNNHIHNTIDSHINGGTVVADSYIHLLATDQDGSDQTSILALAGGVSISTGAVAVGGAVSLNDVGNTVAAHIDGA